MATKRRQRLPLTGGPDAEDMAAARELAAALTEVSILPEADRWSMALELLPEKRLYEAIRTRPDDPEAIMDRCGSLAVAALHTLYGLDPDQESDEINYTEALTLAVYGVLLSCAAELEKRHKRLCRDVVHMKGPVEFDPLEPIQLVPKGEEPVTIRMLMEAYQGDTEHPLLGPSVSIMS